MVRLMGEAFRSALMVDQADVGKLGWNRTSVVEVPFDPEEEDSCTCQNMKKQWILKQTLTEEGHKVVLVRESGLVQMGRIVEKR